MPVTTVTTFRKEGGGRISAPILGRSRINPRPRRLPQFNAGGS